MEGDMARDLHRGKIAFMIGSAAGFGKVVVFVERLERIGTCL
jgi:hypothetical protein